MNYIKKIWNHFFKPDLGKTLNSFNKVMTNLEKVKTYNDQVAATGRRQIELAEQRIAAATAAASRAHGINANIKSLLGE